MIKFPLKEFIEEGRHRPYHMTTTLSLVAFAVWAFTSFARADAVNKLTQGFAKFQELQYAELIQAEHAQWCKATNGSRVILKRNLDAHQREYRLLTGTLYPVAACDDI